MTPRISSQLLASAGLCQLFYALLEGEDAEEALRDLTVPSNPED